jgi:hypothetical protein
MPNIVSELATVQMNLTEQGSTSNLQSSDPSHSVKSTDSQLLSRSALQNSAKPSKLPYQASHQVELLHLQAELDALLQQLQSLKQQRLTSGEQAPELQDTPVHAMV